MAVARVLAVVGARPNVMKTAPILAVLERRPDVEAVLVHTGQHYDASMFQVFLDELGVAAPAYDLGVGSGTHAEQIGKVIERLDPVLADTRPDLLLVAGDVNSTVAAALAGAHRGVPVAHVEAGLRSFDRSMPEEVNRVVTDAVSSVHLIHSASARTNLLREGADERTIHFVGNTMIDTLFAMRDRDEVRSAARTFGVESEPYLLVTLHRPALVDGDLLETTLAQLSSVARRLPVVFPVHPRTAEAMRSRGLRAGEGVTLLPPLGYLDFLGLMQSAAAVLTDSGGVQEETTALGVRCFTLRRNTERPITVEAGTNTLLGLQPERIGEIPELLSAELREAQIPELWDGRAAERVVGVLAGYLGR